MFRSTATSNFRRCLQEFDGDRFGLLPGETKGQYRHP
jgi:hypothetical protein